MVLRARPPADCVHVGTIIIGLLVPSDEPRLNLGSGTAAASPFVIAIHNAGIKGLPSVCRPVSSGIRGYNYLCLGHQRLLTHFGVVGCFQ